MSVFTEVSALELDVILKSNNLGQAHSFRPIAQGTVNSNFELTTSKGHFVLTVFEAMRENLAADILRYMDFLAQRGVPCAKPVPLTHQYIDHIQGKPLAITTFLLGSNPHKPSKNLCYDMGSWLGKIHQVGLGFEGQPPNQMGFNWQTIAYDKIQLPTNEKNALFETIQKQVLFQENSLPKGMIHFDCFRDNVFADNDKVTGMFDFYYACYDYLLIDIAVTMNDWCVDWDLCELNSDKAQSFIDGYQQNRELEAKEKECLSDALELMAAHFWMSRTLTLQDAKQGEGLFEKDPTPFKKLFNYYKKNQANNLRAFISL